MAIIDYTTTSLVAAIKRRGSIPTAQQLFTDTDFIDLANDELGSNILPLIIKTREEYFVSYTDYNVGDYMVDGQVKINIPYNAIGGKLRDVCFVTNSSSNPVLISLPRLSLEDISAGYIDFAKPSGFYIQGNYIILYPNTVNQGTVRLYYLKRPSKLVSTSEAGYITGINTGTNEVTLSFVPNDWTTADTVDIIQPIQPFSIMKTALSISAISSPTITLSSVEGLSVGDWVCLEGESTIPQIPIEAHLTLAQATVVKCLEAMGDREGMQAAEAKLKQNKEDFLSLINPRVDGAPKKVTNSGNGIADWSRAINRRSY